MKVTISNVSLGEPTSTNQVFEVYWKFQDEDDTEYRQEANVTTLPNGNVFIPSPYEFNTGSRNAIDLKLVNTCDPDYFVVVPVDGIGLCCPDGYTITPDGLSCTMLEETAPTYVSIGICVAPSQLNGAYGVAGAKYWENPTYNTTLTNQDGILLGNYWQGNPAGSGGVSPGNPSSPMNREGVWVDTDCDGNKDGLASGATLQFTWLVQSESPRRVYIGAGADNNFRVSLNGVFMAGRQVNSDPHNFNFFHLFPLDLISGDNYILFQATGDGSTNDAVGFVIYDNTFAELQAATQDSDLDILFHTSQLIGADPIDIATCPAGYSLDTTGGSGNYRCLRLTTVPAEPCPNT